MDILVLGKKVNHISFLGIEKIPKYTLKYIKKLSASLCAKLIAYSGNTEHSIPTDDYYTKWREEKEKRVRLEAELAEEKRKH
jgi:hypothetical protein